ncbi:mycofactocin biosynthesis peptidyl-dipeptidase MftE [Nocardia sp. BMG51109]|uniref:mycofactocin biosynthesis peptidyl-dipeptidase MftE n=1 Tax=Nocardia sp. BMG51109 TaxID=1056816 RepID=UPI0004674249|nr:mycofactocin biosynthesis peptidyl-dipeptidase MftE [Nocardia sp. BMG51109]
MNLGDLRSPEFADRIGRTVLAVPLGATEQHGPHLPLRTDTAVAAELCRRLAERCPDIVVAPAIPYGASGEHAGFPGTLSIGHRALELLLVELVRSADDFAGVVLVNGHGGNLQALRSAQRLLTAEQRPPLIWSPTGSAGDSHAGHTETSVMLCLDDSIDLSTASPGNTRPLSEIMPALRERGVSAVSPNGVLGDPTQADPAEGEKILERWTESLVAAVAERF